MSEQNDFQTLIDEKDIPLVKIVAKAAKPYSQRAQAVLELHKGRSVEDAAEISGLRVTQVRYWQRRYRKSGLDVFPEDLLVEENGIEDITDALKAEDNKDSVSRPPSAKSVAQKAQKSKKSKKAKKEKKMKKAPKKDKKADKKKKEGKCKKKCDKKATKKGDKCKKKDVEKKCKKKDKKGKDKKKKK
jgi:hypothetical protein